LNCGLEMGSGGMIYIPRFMKIHLGIQKLLEWIPIQIDSKVISLASFYFLEGK
jgi:hypothetical protein